MSLELRTIGVAAAGLAGGAVLGVGVATNPIAGTAALLACAGAAIMLRLVLVRSVWRSLTGATLLGYLVLTRGFAYTSVRLEGLPIFIGEIALAVALLAIPHREVLGRFLATDAGRWLVPWMVAGVGFLIPGVATHGLDAIRDGAIFYYALFLYVGYAFADRESSPRRLLTLLGAAFLAHLVYSLVFLSGVDIERISPMAPGSDFPLLSYRGDFSALIALGGALFALFVAPHLGWPRWLAWTIAAAQFALFGALQSRGGYVAFAVTLPLLALGRRIRVVQVLGVLAALLALVLVADAVISLEGTVLSPQRLYEEVATIVDVEGRGRYRYQDSEISVSNILWRLEFWRQATAENVRSPMALLFGTGLGRFLTTDGTYLSSGLRPNRSPHSIGITLFARTGLVGLILWLALQAAVWRPVLRAVRRAPRGCDQESLVVLAAFSLATLVSAFLNVLLESPFAAMPYYFLLGVCLRWAGTYDREPRGSSPSGDSRRPGLLKREAA